MSSGLFAGIDLLSLDAGNTFIFLDHDRIASIARDAGHDVLASTLVETEGQAKRALSGDGATMSVAWSHGDAPGARGWGVMMATIFSRAGVEERALPALLERLWSSHCELNLYSKVPEGFRAAMTDVRHAGVKTAVVSNSEGMLEPLFAKLGILDCFDTVVDSAKVGVEKPDPRIFHIACQRTKTAPPRAIHLGDTIATDIVGAMSAGLRAALIDPFRHYEGLRPDIPRVSGVVEAARLVCEGRT